MKFKVHLLFLLAIPLLMFSSCGEEGGTENAEQGKEYTSAYVCPMHCEGSGSEEVGTCPVCGMDYVANEDHESHEDHEGHDHE